MAHRVRSRVGVAWLALVLVLADGTLSAEPDTRPVSTEASRSDAASEEVDEHQKQADEVASSLISNLLRDDDNGNFTPGPLMRLAMGLDEPEGPTREVDPAAYIELSDDLKGRLEHTLKRMAAEDGPEAEGRTNAEYPLQVALARGQADLMRALEPYRTIDEGARARRPAIRMGGGPGESPLGADINNYAPDNFEVAELEKLFELGDELRQRIATDANEPTGVPIVDMSELKEVNVKVLNSYIRALAGIRLASEHKPDEASAECAICRDNPAPVRWLRLPCGHAYHRNCTARWARAQDARANSCPECRRPFRLPFGLSEFDQP